MHGFFGTLNLSFLIIMIIMSGTSCGCIGRWMSMLDATRRKVSVSMTGCLNSRNLFLEIKKKIKFENLQE